MKLKKLLVASFLASIVLSNVAFAREATQSELKALNEVASNYRDATVNKNVDGLIAGIPPRVIKILTEISKPVDGIPLDEIKVKENIKRDITSFTEIAKVLSWEVDLKNKKAGTLDVTAQQRQNKETGEPFFIIPSTTVVELKVKKQSASISDTNAYELKRQKITSDVIAVLDEGKWYILSADNPMQLLVYQRAFPGIEKAQLRKPVIVDAK
ncbi:hypothetical protein N5853_08735 [Bartonella sp. HY329]|uniref:hypothetical protein n=1 Tax=unclassified Bartonella TaxID=2645622 RepID=UPI0021C59485|nr:MULTISPECIES: hypothetical protein [unclassified Bartonella]UXM94198.1 hypothetical protein N5853_08735 [Bartonella sp. HY329]UXN08520.1 hypothetical protein N5852_08745 [Bartonella sp. HY328]